MTEPLKILYVDDEDDIREIAGMSLELDPDIELRTAASGSAALAIVQEWLPDLILLDVMMPGMDGPETLARLKQDEVHGSVPVIFITARTRPEDIECFLGLGAEGVISKPFDPMTLATQARELFTRVKG
ncbi:response regulator [Hoeflea sp. G2-23]|uniref:Response regulator n=1 Tax=Hoeflea algicola TaxID=2983763 RepID=A0ABT3ZBX0_9HYPH|nr:response regulator [Hoeflea algicola]MCY0148804.1 response regulator [Hoeflea algicola]